MKKVPWVRPGHSARPGAAAPASTASDSQDTSCLRRGGRNSSATRTASAPQATMSGAAICAYEMFWTREETATSDSLHQDSDGGVGDAQQQRGPQPGGQGEQDERAPGRGLDRGQLGERRLPFGGGGGRSHAHAADDGQQVGGGQDQAERRDRGHGDIRALG